MHKPKLNINPMFRNESKQPSPFHTTLNVRKANEKTKKVRRERGDKKHDVKVPLRPDLIKEMEYQAFRKNLSLTSYAAVLLAKGLKLDSSLFPEGDYNPRDRMVHCKTPRFLYEKLFHYKVEWGCRSMRRAAHRIIVEMIMRERVR